MVQIRIVNLGVHQVLHRELLILCSLFYNQRAKLSDKPERAMKELDIGKAFSGAAKSEIGISETQIGVRRIPCVPFFSSPSLFQTGRRVGMEQVES